MRSGVGAVRCAPAAPPCDMNGTRGGGLGEQLRHRLAAAHVGAQRLGEVRRHRQVEAAHHLDERGAVALLQARVVGDLLADRRVAAALVVVRRIDLAARGRASAAFRTGCRTAPPGSPVGRSVRPVPPISSVSPVKTRSSATRHIESRVWPGVCSTCSRSLPTTQHLAVVDAHVDARRRARAVHDHAARRAAAPAAAVAEK